MLVLGSVTSLSMSALFAAGLLPAAVIAVCVMALVFFRSRGKVRQPGRRVSPAALVRLGWQAILPFSMPVLLFYGIFSGFATPTEVSAFAVAYGFILACFVYREVNFEVLGRIVVDASSVAAMVLFTLAAAQSFSWVLSAAQLPHALATLVSNMSGSITIFLLGSMAALIILGSLLEGLPAILILAPLLLPIATDIGINDLHFGILMLIAMGIGAFLPPLGVGFYIACTVVRAPMGDSTRRMMSYVVVLVIGLLLVAFVPWFTLSVPRLLGLAP
jgi:tripartite ATP-independent transporter DctM subunit